MRLDLTTVGNVKMLPNLTMKINVRIVEPINHEPHPNPCEDKMREKSVEEIARQIFVDKIHPNFCINTPYDLWKELKAEVINSIAEAIRQDRQEADKKLIHLRDCHIETALFAEQEHSAWLSLGIDYAEEALKIYQLEKELLQAREELADSKLLSGQYFRVLKKMGFENNSQVMEKLAEITPTRSELEATLSSKEFRIKCLEEVLENSIYALREFKQNKKMADSNVDFWLSDIEKALNQKAEAKTALTQEKGL